MTDATINFFVCLVGVAFGLAGMAGVYDVFAKVERDDQETRYLRSIFMLALLVILGSMLPLALSEMEQGLGISAKCVSLLGSALYGFILYEILLGKAKIQHILITVVLLLLTGIVLIIFIWNAVATNNIVLYKIALLWCIIVLSYRLYLFIRHLVRLHTTRQ